MPRPARRAARTAPTSGCFRTDRRPTAINLPGAAGARAAGEAHSNRTPERGESTMAGMKSAAVFLVLAYGIALSLAVHAQQQGPGDGPRYTHGKNLVRPGRD